MTKLKHDDVNAVAPRDGTGVASHLIRWMFLNRRTGHMTVAQWPNIPLSVFLLLSIALRLGPSGHLETALRVSSWVALVAWAVDEIVRGVNPFRRILGSVVLLSLGAGFYV